VDIPLEPPFPEPLRYVWEWYQELARGRGSSGFGPNPISWLDVLAWSGLMDMRLERWELRALRLLDLSYLLAIAEKESEL